MKHTQSPNPLTFRRTAFAILVGLVTLVVTVGVVGFAAADEGSVSKPPERYSVASPRLHDRGLYRVSEVEFVSGSMKTTLPPQDSLEFGWERAETVRDAAGLPHLAHVLRYRAAPLFPERAEQRAYVDVATGELVASTIGLEFADGSTMLGLSIEFANQMEVTYHLRPGAKAAQPFCGLQNALQGQEVDLDGRFELFAPCYFGYKVGTEGDMRSVSIRGRFEAVASERLGGLDTVVFGDHAANPQYVWMARDVPYPVQILTFKSPTAARLIQLESFSEGTDQLATEGHPSALPPVPPLDWAPRTAHGPADNGVNHVFPLSDAYSRAIADPEGKELRAFLATHSNATMMAADYDEQLDEDWHEIYWHMKFVAGDKELNVGYARQVGVRVPGAPLLSDPVYFFHNRTIDPYREVKHPSAEKVPTMLPTVSSMMAQWSAYSGKPSSEARSWGFFIECNDEECRIPRVRILAGSELIQGNNPISPYLAEQRRDGLTDVLELGFRDGASVPTTVTTIIARSQNVYTGPLSPSGTTFPSEPSEAERLSTASKTAWTWPAGGYVVGAGVFAFLVALAYWLWPAVRHTIGFGFFTRLEKPALLEHPIRQEIVSLVENNPGIHFAEIARRLGVGNGNAEHHLRHLVANNLLGEVEAKGYTCYYVPGAIGADAARALPALKSRGARAILAAIAKRPGINAQQVARAIGMSGPTVHYHLTRLLEVGLVESVRSGRGLELRPTAAATTVLDIAA